MGSVTTWHTFQYCLDYFRYFMPMSGNLTGDGQFMDQIVRDAGYGWEDFFIYAMSGTDDFAYSAFADQIEAMLAVPAASLRRTTKRKEMSLSGYRRAEPTAGNTRTSIFIMGYAGCGMKGA